VVAQLGKWLLSYGCGSSSIEDEVDHWRMWWLRWECGGSVADVVAQLGILWLSLLSPLGDTRLQQSRVQVRHFSQSPERGQYILLRIIIKSQFGTRPCLG
jgi:fumarate reductase subunit D